MFKNIANYVNCYINYFKKKVIFLQIFLHDYLKIKADTKVIVIQFFLNDRLCCFCTTSYIFIVLIKLDFGLQEMQLADSVYIMILREEGVARFFSLHIIIAQSKYIIFIR